MTTEYDIEEPYWKIEKFAEDIMLQYEKTVKGKGENRFIEAKVLYEILEKMKQHGLIREFGILTFDIAME